jgi:hypothetical protein
VNALDFRLETSGVRATMGQEAASAKGANITVTIRFRTPDRKLLGDNPVLDHLDLIAGKVTGKVAPKLADGSPNPDYSKDTNDTTKVVRTFTSADWTQTPDGWTTMQYTTTADSSMYFRLRGTNLAPNTASQTDAAGNPLKDTASGADAARKSLWLYSNPIFVTVP